MVFDLSEVTSLGPYEKKPEKTRTLYLVNDKVFLVENKNTLELRSDEKLINLLVEKYESVMHSRYFGRAGLEIVPSSQLTKEDLADLIRLSYRLTSS